MKIFKVLSFVIVIAGTVIVFNNCSVSSLTPDVITPSKYLYVTNSADDNIGQYKINSDGSLTAMAAPTVVSGDGPNGIIKSSDNKYMYVTNRNSDNISQYSIGADGGLTAIAAPIATGSTPNFSTLSPNGKFLYVGNLGSDNITRYSIAANGVLTFSATMASNLDPASITFSPDGAFAYVVNDGPDIISQYSVAADGSFSPLSPATVASVGCQQAPPQVEEASTGEFYLYVMSCPSQNIEVYAINKISGQLTSIGTYGVGINPMGMDARGGFLYVGIAVGSEIAMFSMLANGTLNPLVPPTVTTGLSIEAVAINATNTYLYVLDSGPNEILVYSIAGSGQITRKVSIPAIPTGALPTHILIL